MSASRDSSQKVTFIYTNFYSLYKKGKEAAVSSQPFAATPETGRVIRSGNMRPGLRVRTYEPVQFDHADHPRSNEVQSLKDNLKSIKNLQSRLHFMLAELQDLSKKDEE